MEKYLINTGEIFEELQNQWKKYNRTFLESIENPIFQVLNECNIISVPYEEENANHLEHYSSNRYPRALELAKQSNNFPFPNYYLKYFKNKRGFDIVFYYEPCEIGKENIFFDLFFSLKFSLTDIMEADAFLHYHLEKTFENEILIFKTFLENISIKYKEFLFQEYLPIIHRFLSQQSFISEPIKENNKEFTTARQVLAVTYLLEELNINRQTTRLTEIAKFIQFLTGKEAGAPKINDTTIYKKVKSPFAKTDKKVEEDLQFIRKYFENLKLKEIVKKINKEIGSNE